MRVVLHVGMPKTGSTSIQQAFQGQRGPGWEYGDFPARNHSAALALLYDDDAGLADYPGFWPKGADFMAGLPRQREIMRERLDEQWDRLGGTGDALVLSGEALWSARRDLVREGLAAEAARRGASVEVIAYLRPPLSYAVSAFQQRLKGPKEPRAFSLDGFWPSYQRSIEGLDAAFGRDNVRLRLFDRSALKDGDVVEDFCDVMGLPLARGEGGRPKANESLGADAAAFLYAARRGGLAFPTGHPKAMSKVRALIAGLRRMGTRRFTFDPALFADALADRRDEMAWTEARLGRPLREAPDPGALVIRSEDDLLALAETARAHEAAREFEAAVVALGGSLGVSAPKRPTRPDLEARRAARAAERERRRADRPKRARKG